MAYIVADRVKETTTVTGTGPATLLGAASGYRSFASQLSIGDTCAYAIVNANASEWEVGIGTYSAVNTLTRTTIQASTNSNAVVNFSAGTKDVFLAPTANTILSDVTSTDGTVTFSKTGSIVDLSVAVAAAATNVIVQVRNNTGATLTKGTVVYINNAIGQIPTVGKAIATSDATSAQTLGMISADLANNSNGYVTIIGLISNINTSAYVDGDQLYLSGTTAGTFTKVKPYAPTHLVYVGIVEHAHVTQGKIFVKVQNGYELDELHDVSAQSPSNGQTIIYNSSNQLWEQNTVSLTAGVNGTLPVANGGTGVTTATGSGSVVLSTAPTLTTATFAAGTITTSAPAINVTQTWNAVGTTFTSLFSNVTDSASAFDSLLVDLQVGSASKFKVLKSGIIYVPDQYPAVNIGNSANDGINLHVGGIGFTQSGVQTVAVTNTEGLWINSGFPLSFGSGRGNGQTRIYSDSNYIIAQRNGTNAQAFRLYNTYTDASNYERLGVTWSSNICTIGLAQAGTGLPRTLNVNANAVNAPALPVAATVTAATGNGTTVTYTCASTFAIGQVVSITGLTITTGSSLNLSNQTITGVTTTAFTVNNATVGTAAATQAGTATIQSAGNSVIINGGNGSGVGAGGNIILQPGAQGSGGGDGVVRVSGRLGLSSGSNALASSIDVWNGSYDSNSALLIGGDIGAVGSRTNNTRKIAAIYAKPYSTTGLNAHIITHDSSGSTHILWIGGGSDKAYAPTTINMALGTTATTTSPTIVLSLSGTGYITATGSFNVLNATTAFSANTNDLALTASGFQRINCTVAASLTGIAPPSGGTHVDGRMVRVYNVGTANLTLAHNSALSTAANRMFSSTGADIVLSTHQYVELIYDSTDNGRGGAGWRVSSVH
jgi:hypothetical protein